MSEPFVVFAGRFLEFMIANSKTAYQDELCTAFRKNMEMYSADGYKNLGSDNPLLLKIMSAYISTLDKETKLRPSVSSLISIFTLHSKKFGYLNERQQVPVGSDKVLDDNIKQ